MGKLKKTTAEIRAYIQNKIITHFNGDGIFISINSGDIEKELEISDCTPQVCSSMRNVMTQYPCHVIERPFNNDWAGTRLTIRYYKNDTAYKADDTREETIIRQPRKTADKAHFAELEKQICVIDPQLIKTNVFDFYNEIIIDPNGRFKSWEHCYEFFKANRHRKDEGALDRMSLHLAFYLASWGMLRGSSFLLQKDYRVHLPAIQIMLEEKYDSLWGGAASNLVRTVDLLLECSDRIEGSYQQQVNCKKPSQTLLTKMLLGVYGCVPAYDRYFTDGLKHYGLTATYGKKSLLEVFEFYKQNGETFEECRKLISQQADYPPMKLLDMFFWLVGVKLDKKSIAEAIAESEE